MRLNRNMLQLAMSDMRDDLTHLFDVAATITNNDPSIMAAQLSVIIRFARTAVAQRELVVFKVGVGFEPVELNSRDGAAVLEDRRYWKYDINQTEHVAVLCSKW